MSRVNQCNFLVDFTSNKYFDETEIGKETKIPFARFIGYIPGTDNSRPVSNLRFIAYGYRAELTYAYIQAGTRAFLFSHLQVREDYGKAVMEFVIDDIQYIKGENREEGRRKYLELVERGVLVSSCKDLRAELAEDQEHEASK